MVDRIIKERIQGVGERLFNNPLTRVNTNGVRYRTTRMRLPSWVDRDTMTEGVDSVPSSLNFTVNRISGTRPVDRLRQSPMFENVRKHFKAAPVLEDIKEKAPVDDQEIVGWMQQSAADSAVMSSWARAYGKNSSVEAATGDPRFPANESTADFSFRGQRNQELKSSGTATFQTPNGNVSIADKSSKLVADGDTIGWGAAESEDRGVQWKGTVAQFKDLAETPIENPLPFPEVGSKMGRQKIPNILNQVPPEQSEETNINFNVSANGPKELNLKLRNPNNYNEILTEGTFSVPEGTSNVEFNMTSAPAVPPLATQITAQGDTQSMESFTVNSV
jgi:hypothetical protein